MDVKQFASLWKKEVDSLIAEYTSDSSSSIVKQKISEMNLSQNQISIMNEAVLIILKDAFYTALLSLDGAASMGGIQKAYKILDEDGVINNQSGDLEAAA